MRRRTIIALASVVLCFALSSAWAGLVFNEAQVSNIDLAGTSDIEDHNISKITTLNLLAGCIGITFSGWLLRKRTTS